MDKRTIDSYDAQAKEYDEETTDFWTKFPRTFIDGFIENTKGTVLDVGSGPGRDGLILQTSGLEVTCIDASKSMVEISTARGLHSVVGDFIALPFPDHSFDGVWAYTSLLHVPKSEVAGPLSEIYRVLKTNGTFGIGLIEGDGEMYRGSRAMDQPRWFSDYSKDEVEKLLNEAGFTVTYFETFKPGSRNYLNFICEKH